MTMRMTTTMTCSSTTSSSFHHRMMMLFVLVNCSILFSSPTPVNGAATNSATDPAHIEEHKDIDPSPIDLGLGDEERPEEIHKTPPNNDNDLYQHRDGVPTDLYLGNPTNPEIHQSYGHVRECPKIPLATCDELDNYGIHHEEECECKEFHGEGEFTCRTRPGQMLPPVNNNGGGGSGGPPATTTEGESVIWCHGKLSRAESFLMSKTKGTHHGATWTSAPPIPTQEALKAKEDENRQKQAEAAAQAEKDAAQQKQARLITGLGCSGLLVVAVMTTLLGRGRNNNNERRRRSPVSPQSLDINGSSTSPNTTNGTDPELQLDDEGGEDESSQQQQQQQQQQQRPPENQVEMATFA